MKKHMTKLAVVLLLATSGAVHALPILDIQGGQLFGASGVDVGGTLYDVQFVDGTCAALFSGCDEVGDFTFQTQADAVLASQALMAQVFLDSGLGMMFDTQPFMMNGCEVNNSGCVILTLYGFNGTDFLRGVWAFNDVDEQFDSVVPFNGVPITHNTAGTTISIYPGVYAVWQIQPSTPVSEPSSLAVLALGLFVLGLSRRRHQR